MIRLVALVGFGLTMLGCAEEEPVPQPTNSLTVMSFNIWRSGGRSLERTIAAIRLANVDVVGLQESNLATTATIAKALGFSFAHDDRTNAVLSRYPVEGIGKTKSDWGGLGATVTIGDRRVHVFDTHLFWDVYGPYHLREGVSQEQILAQENTHRMPGLNEVFDLMRDALAAKEPALLLGDFNAPSHLDYASFPWPESVACEARGLRDSYRELHPNNRTYPGAFAFDEPGITWTPIVEEEVRGDFDRIDFVYYSGNMAPKRSTEIDERNGVVPWPSDHRAVVTTFAW